MGAATVPCVVKFLGMIRRESLRIAPRDVFRPSPNVNLVGNDNVPGKGHVAHAKVDYASKLL